MNIGKADYKKQMYGTSNSNFNEQTDDKSMHGHAHEVAAGKVTVFVNNLRASVSAEVAGVARISASHSLNIT